MRVVILLIILLGLFVSCSEETSYEEEVQVPLQETKTPQNQSFQEVDFEKCAQVEEDLLSLIREKNHCEVDSDCIVVQRHRGGLVDETRFLVVSLFGRKIQNLRIMTGSLQTPMNLRCGRLRRRLANSQPSLK